MTSSTSWHRGRLPPAAAVTATTDNDCHRHADNNLNCRISRPADNNRNNIYRTVGEAEAADNMGRLSRLVSDVEENYYQTIHTPQAADKRGGRPPLLLSDYQSLAGSPAKSTSSSAGRLSSSDYQAVGSPLAARSQPPHLRLFESPRRRAGGPPTQSLSVGHGPQPVHQWPRRLHPAVIFHPLWWAARVVIKKPCMDCRSSSWQTPDRRQRRLPRLFCGRSRQC